MDRRLHHRLLAIQCSECQWNQLYKHTKNSQNFRWSCTDFMDVWKKLLKSPRINSNSCTKELVSHGGLYDKNIVWHPQKRIFSVERQISQDLTLGLCCSQIRRVLNEEIMLNCMKSCRIWCWFPRCFFFPPTSHNL